MTLTLSPQAQAALDRRGGLFPDLPPDVVELVLPWPTSANAYWRSFVPKGWKRPVVHVSDEGKAFQREVQRIVRAKRVGKLLGPLLLEATLHPPDRRGHDLDNRLKPMIDALKLAGVFVDDVQIREIHAKFGPVVADGRAVVKLMTLGV